MLLNLMNINLKYFNTIKIYQFTENCKVDGNSNLFFFLVNKYFFFLQLIKNIRFINFIVF